MFSSFKVYKVILLLLSIYSILNVAEVWADGMAWDFTSRRPLYQKEQRAAIAHSDGVEKMIIAVNFELEEENSAVWIFPVPGMPEEIEIDAIDRFPEFRGQDPLSRAPAKISFFMHALRSTQIYTIPYYIWAELTKPLGAGSTGFTIHDKFEKWGLHVETVSITSLEDMAEYLEERNLEFIADDLELFEPYISDPYESDGYTLVVSWISSKAQLLKEFPEYAEKGKKFGRQRWPCLYVEFPTEQPFYPMRLTSSYGDVTIPLRLYIIGFVTLDLRPEIQKKKARQELENNEAFKEKRFIEDARQQIQYYQQSQFNPVTDIRFIEGLPASDIPYTRIFVGFPAGLFNRDLWFTSVPPPKGFEYASRLNLLEGHFYFSFPLALILLSYFSGGIAGLMVFKRWNRYALIGLINLLTFIAVVIVANKFGIRPKFFIIFTITFVILTILIEVMLYLPL